MKKIIGRVLIVLVVLLVVAVIIVDLSLDGIVRRKVETQASDSLNLTTTLGSAKLALFGGKLNLNNLQIASPGGFTAPHMLELGDTDVAVSYGQLRNQPVHVQSLTLKGPKLVIEQAGNQFNFKKAMDLMPKSDPNAEPMKLVIDDLRVEGAQVVVKPDPNLLQGLAHEFSVSLPSISLKNVGTGDGSQNGAAIKDVVMQVVSAMAASASQSGGIPDQLKQMLHANLGDVVGKLSGEAQKRIMAAVPGDVGKTLSEAIQDPSKLTKDPAAAVKQGLEGVMKGKSADGSPASQPSPQDAVDTVKGFLNSGKKK